MTNLVKASSLKMAMNENGSTELLQAQTQTWNHIYNFVSSSAAKCAVQLGIPDVLYKHGKSMCLSDISAALPLNPSKISFLPILMRSLVQSGFLYEHEDYYTLTPASRLFVKDDPLSMRSYFLIMHDPCLQKPWFELSSWFQNDFPTAFHTAHNGKSLWDYFADEPRGNDIFNDSMANDSRLIADVLITECKHVFEGLTSLVDVGGGTGTLAIAIAKAFPAINCTVLDLPHVIGDLKGSGNLEFVGGSMFEKIPNANAILLKWILHNWGDEDCVKILKKCKASIPSREKGGKVIIIDIVLENPKEKEDSVRAQHNMDLVMMVLFAAKERTKKEWEKLFTEAGFNEYEITPTMGTRSLIEIYP
ncbi:myricetin 7/4'-O-methyltransferase 2 [Nicotiana tabacum]|uniref:Myricetin 7/4'-O-methyltransferase 2 n=1 Tax=Nicotiana tabacum TaxID=4097 RepID=A0A1S4BYM8_TOBAC|nr:PREDICTED: trans-resveratrol di-O-methyltransferase-like [Nicotiana tabacum]